MKSIQVNVQRFDPYRTPPIYSQLYKVKVSPGTTVLELLEEIRNNIDSSLSFRSSCRSSKCGTCAVSLNGRPVLACRTMVEGDSIELGPLHKRQVVRDLIVDERIREKEIQKVIAESHQTSVAYLAESKDIYTISSRCIECTICTAACPFATQGYQVGPTPDLLSTMVGGGIRVSHNDFPAIPIEENIDFCSLCMNCSASCPVSVNLGYLNVQAKSAYAQEQGLSPRNWLFGRPDFLGKLGCISPAFSNLALHSKLIRMGIGTIFKISPKADLPLYHSPFKLWFDRHPQHTSPSAKHKVAFFVGCFNNYNETQPAKDAVIVLEYLGIHIVVPQQECCGMPMMANGDLEGARRRAKANLIFFQPWLKEGYDVIATCTTGSLMLKKEYKETLKLEEAEELASHTYDLGEYLRLLTERGELDPGRLQHAPLKIGYQTPCHLKAQHIGFPFVELLNKIPELQIDVLDTACCGLSGSYGLKSEMYETSMSVARHLYASLNTIQPNLAMSECGTCQLQMRHGTGLPTKHPISILRKALVGTNKDV